MQHDDYSEKMIQKLLRSRDKQEARAWINSTKRGVTRTVGELSAEESTALIDTVYSLGATEVFVVEVQSSPNGVVESTDTLIAALPDNAAARASIFQWDRERVQMMGYEGEEDHGQSHMLIWFD